MITTRRKLLMGLLAGAATLALTPFRVWAARPEAPFQSNTVSGALKGLFGSDAHSVSSDITVKAPDIAENGAVVPITVNFTIPNAESVAIIAENNPNPLAAAFIMTAASGGLVSTRIKMGKTSNVHAVVKANGKLYSAVKEVKVTIGGCGG